MFYIILAIILIIVLIDVACCIVSARADKETNNRMQELFLQNYEKDHSAKT